MRRRAFLASVFTWSPLAVVSRVWAQTPSPTANATPDGHAKRAEDNNGTVFITALITAAVTLTGIILKDLVFKILEERRAERRAEIAVYERYSKPLAASAIPLLYRLREILLQEHRPVFLKGIGIPVGVGQGSTFRAYKKLSTLYRLANLLGWIRACRREFSYLRVAERTENEPIARAIETFENALADGSWVEQERVRRLCDLWHICSVQRFEQDPHIVEAVGVKVDNAIYDQLEVAQVAELEALSENDRKALSVVVASSLAEAFRTNDVGSAVMERTWPEAFSVLSMREAWVYRDWQSAIGDMMLRPLEGESRKFEVIGYGEFEQMYLSGDHAVNQWTTRLCEVFDEINLSIEDRFDARPRQLRTMARAAAELILALHSAQGSQTIVPDFALKIANEILARVPARS